MIAIWIEPPTGLPPLVLPSLVLSPLPPSSPRLSQVAEASAQTPIDPQSRHAGVSDVVSAQEPLAIKAWKISPYSHAASDVDHSLSLVQVSTNAYPNVNWSHSSEHASLLSMELEQTIFINESLQS